MSFHIELLGEYMTWAIIGVVFGYLARVVHERFSR